MGLFRRNDRRARARSDEVVIDLRDGAPAPAPAPGELVWGMPSRCPECGGYGYLDTIDVERGVMRQHCPTCWARWEVTQEQIEAQARARADG